MKHDREQALAARLSIVQKLSLAEAMAFLDISESTARRMFAKLEQDGVAIRTHGGIQSVGHALTSYSFESGSKKNIEKKTLIARLACEFLEDGDVIFCDSGTTIQCFCAAMVQRLRKEKLNIKVYTNSLANLELLSPHLKVSLIGGEYRANRKDFCGYMAEQALSGLYFTKSFVGADGCVNGKRFTTTDFETLRMNEIAMANAEKNFMLVDSSKFSVISHVAYAPLQDLHTIVTDSGIDPQMLTTLEEGGVRVVLAREEETETHTSHRPDLCNITESER